MKVLHLIGSMGYGGAEKLVADLLPLLKNMGIQISLVSMTDQLALSTSVRNAKIPVYTLEHRGTIYQLDRMCKSVKRLRVILNKENPDIVHSHLYMPDIVSRLSSPLKCRLITTLHQTDPWWQERMRLRSILKTLLDRLSGKIRKTYYIAISKEIEGVACKRLRIPKRRIRTISNGINLLNFQFRDRNNNLHPPIIIQVGRFYEVKGHRTSLKAFHLLKENYPEARLILVGDGPLRFAVENEAKLLRLDESVKFLGTRDDIPELLQQADIFWMPSQWEGLPIACLEAMACGLPVVASSVGGLKELVIDGKTGYLIEKGAFEQLAVKTVSILTDSNLAKQMGLAGRQRVEEHYSVEETARNYGKAYEDLLEGEW